MTTATATDLMTAEAFFAWVHRPENADRWFELERGKVIEMPPPGHRHGVVCGTSAGFWAITSSNKVAATSAPTTQA